MKFLLSSVFILLCVRELVNSAAVKQQTKAQKGERTVKNWTMLFPDQIVPLDLDPDERPKIGVRIGVGVGCPADTTRVGRFCVPLQLLEE